MKTKFHSSRRDQRGNLDHHFQDEEQLVASLPVLPREELLLLNLSSVVQSDVILIITSGHLIQENLTFMSILWTIISRQLSTKILQH